ncbi:FG-GAP-like repeat-containing protein [Actinomadura sp. HBU206391]|uniref:FG-GAP-like repeat-containing protein n=1 Tax=Actinomadura sp. HBU206391 TaxID=2731692 RepID=UPI0016504406|nr:FG-GAP-like repeat-containing protein [Actinomadura sp. HBU206391]MBC6461593.1 FG-GAP repeat protein [Actinomadura sp. HBU206391]
MRFRSVITMGAAVAVAMALGTVPAGASAAAPAGAGDFNGDGRRDTAFGSPFGYVGGVRGGFVTVVYGGATGLDPATRKELSQNSAGVPGSVAANNQFGASLASADFDRDGYADLAVGAPGEKVGEFTHGGTVSIVYGSAAGLSGRTARIALDDAHQSHTGRFGESLAIADFSSDGAPDLAVSAPADRAFWTYGGLGGGGTAGTRVPLDDDQFFVQELRLTAADFTGDGRADLTASRQESIDGVMGGRVDLYAGSASGLTLLRSYAAEGGRAAAAGDINGDGRVDLVTRVFHFEDDEANGGTVAVNLGTGTGFRRQLLLTQDTAGVPGTGEEGDAFGADLAVGDFNGDGRADVGIGAPGEAIGTVNRAGAFTVLYGGSSGLTTTGAVQIGQNTSGVPGNAESGDLFGGELSAADITGDGKADLTVAARGEDTSEGAVWLFPGATSGLTGTGSTALNTTNLGITGRGAQLGDVILP